MFGDLLKLGGTLWEGSKNRKQSKKQFKMQMDESIQRRVADAQKAGVHPLFALGASVGASPTNVVGSGVGDALGNIGAAIDRKIRSKGEKASAAAEADRVDKLTAAQINQANAAAGRDAAEAALLASQQRRLETDMYSTGHDHSALESQGLVTFPLGKQPTIDNPIPIPVVTEKGAKQVSGERQLMAHPTDNVYQLPLGFQLRTKAGFSPMEALEQHYGDVGSAPWQVLAVIEDSLSGRLSNPTLERWLKKAGGAGRRWMERELWKIETRFNEKRSK